MKSAFSSVCLLLTTSILLGCDGQDRFEDCYFNGEPVPEYEITVFDAVTGEKICWTEFNTREYIGDKGWEYAGICEYTFEDSDSRFAANITVIASGYESLTLNDIRKPAAYLCLLEGEQTVVEAYLSPL